MEITVYISYCDEDEHLINQIVNKLKAYYSYLKINNQKTHDSLTPQKQALKLLDETHCVLAFLTQSSIKSITVIDELARAHDRHLPILFLMDDSLNQEQLPWYFSQDQSSKFEYHQAISEDTKAALFKSICAFFDTINTENKTDLLKHISYYRNLVLSKTSDHIPYKYDFLNQQLSTSTDYASDVFSGECNYYYLPLTTFFFTVTPMVKTAKELYIISLAHQENFWLDQQYRGYSYDFLNQHPNSCCRLFVFKNPRELHEYQSILDAHYQKYGFNKSTSGVFITTYEHYQKLLRSIVNDNPKALSYCNDHSIALLKHQGQQYNDDWHQLLYCEKRFSLIDPDLNEPWIKSSLMITFFKNILSLNLGQSNHQRSVWRWHPHIHQSNNQYKRLLQDMFRIEDGLWYGSVDYFIFFNRNYQSMRYLNKYKLLVIKQLKKCFGDLFSECVVNIHLNQKNSVVRVLDQRWHSELMLDAHYPCSLTISFKTLDDFLQYCHHQDTSILRETLYCTINSDLKRFFKQIKTVTRKRQGEIFQHIERLANQDTKRVFYQQCESLDDIISEPPVKFMPIKKLSA